MPVEYDGAQRLNRSLKLVQSLENSVLQLPDSLLLIELTENGKQVIGHSRLTRVLEDPHGCWIGSVVIEKEKRKQGYGKYLMQKTEEYARSLQYLTAYLNTHDQEGFYEHLGYTYCDPVSSINFNRDVNLKNFITNTNHHQQEIYLNQSSNKQSYSNNAHHQQSYSSNNTIPPPPPPLPPVQIANHNFRRNNKSNLGQYWMKKKL